MPSKYDHHVGQCTRCKGDLIVNVAESMGNCQPNCLYRVGLKEVADDRMITVFNGAKGPVRWEGMLCDRCVDRLRDFLEHR